MSTNSIGMRELLYRFLFFSLPECHVAASQAAFSVALASGAVSTGTEVVDRQPSLVTFARQGKKQIISITL